MSHPDFADRAATVRLLDMLVEHLSHEPSTDAGQHPSLDLHARIGDEWAAWDRQRAAFEALLAPRLLREAIADLLGAIDSRPYPAEADR